MNAIRIVSRCVAVSSLLSLAACATSTEVPPQTQQGLTDLRSQLVSGKAQIQRATDAARDLTQRPQAQIYPQINRLATEVEALDAMASESRQQFEGQQDHTKQYFAQWDAQLKTMSESVRRSGQARRAESLRSFDTLGNKIASLRATFRPYIAALREAVKYLRTDPTALGVKSITPRVDEALGVEKMLMEKVDTVTAQIDDMRGSK